MSIFVAEIFADATNQAMESALMMKNVATDYSEFIPELATCGDSVNFANFARIPDAVTVSRDDTLTPNAVSMVDCNAPIKVVANAVRIKNVDAIQIKGNVKDRMAEQLGESMAKAVDVDLATAVVDGAVYKENVLKSDFNATAIESALDCFGDRQNVADMAGIIAHSSLRSAIVNMDEFSSANKTNTAYGNGIVADNILGFWNGIPIYLCDTGTSYEITVEGSKKNAVMFAVLKKNALAYVFQARPSIEEMRQSLDLATDVVASELYATKLIDSAGASLLNVYTA